MLPPARTISGGRRSNRREGGVAPVVAATRSHHALANDLPIPALLNIRLQQQG